MILTTLYALSFAALAAAQSSSTIVSVFLPNADTMSSLVGSIAGSDASATTYVIGCASIPSPSAAPSAAAASTGANSSDLAYTDPLNGCGFQQSQTVTQGPSTYHWVVSESQVPGAVTVDCVLSGSTVAVCTETATGSAFTAAATSGLEIDSGLPPLSTDTLSGTDFPPYQKVTITAGLSNLKASGASSIGSAGSTATSTGTAASGGPTTKSSSGAMVMEPALVMGAAGMLAVGLVAVAL